MKEKFRHALSASLLVGVLALSACDAFRSAEERTARAEALIARHEYREAVIELRNALQGDPGHLPARVKLAEVELLLGDAASAEKDLRRAIEGGLPVAGHAELIARIDLALGRAAELLARIDSAELSMDDATRAFYRGLALLDLRRFVEARDELGRIAEKDRHYLEARVGVANALAGEGQVTEAMQELNALVERAPRSFAALLARGTLHARRGEFAPAERDLQTARSLPDDELEFSQRLRLLASLCEVMLSQGNAKAAAEIQRELAGIASDAAVTQVLAARIAIANQDYASATAQLQRTLVAAPNAMPIRLLLGVSLFAQGNLHQAEQQLSLVVQRAPEILEARKLLAQLQLTLGRPEAAVQLLSGSQRADDPQLTAMLGLARMQQGDEGAGVAHLESAAAASPGNRTLQLELASAYLRAERVGDALRVLNLLRSTGSEPRLSGLLVAAREMNGERDAAKAELERMVEAHPKDVEVLAFAAQYAAYQRDFERARRISDRAIRTKDDSPQPLLSRARIEAQAGDFPAAEQWLKKALDVDPGNEFAHLALAQLAAQRGDIAAATKTLEDLRKRDATSVEARLQLLSLYLRGSDAAASRGVTAELVKLGETRPEISNALGQMYFENGRYDEALQRFRDASSRDDANPVYWLNLARTQVSQGNAGVARESLDKALSARPRWLPAVGMLAMLDVKDGRAPAALARVEELVKANPRDASALMMQGDLQMVLKDYSKAMVSYKTAAAVSPSAELAVKSFEARREARAPEPTQPLEKWLAAHPDDDALRMLLANAWQSAGEPARAIGEYEFLESRGRASALALNNLAWLYHEAGLPRAEEVGLKAYKMAPRSPPVADTYGWILVENGKAAEAVEVFKPVVGTTQDPSIEFHYAVALIRSGAVAEGSQRLTALLARSPDFPDAAAAKALLASVAGKTRG